MNTSDSTPTPPYSADKAGTRANTEKSMPLEADLRRAGMRVTRPRLAVLGALRENPHAEVEVITTAARAELGSLSTQAVYDILHALTGAHLARRIEPAGHPARYETRVGDNHHHVVCRRCGAMADVDCAAEYRPCLTARDTHGFSIDEAEVIYWGICARCRTK